MLVWALDKQTCVAKVYLDKMVGQEAFTTRQEDVLLRAGGRYGSGQDSLARFIDCALMASGHT